MHIQPLHRIAIIAPFYIVAVIVLFIPLLPGVASFSSVDSFIHTGLFFVLGTVTFFTYQKETQFVAVGLIIFGAYSELLQSLTTTRTTDPADLLNNYIGIALALFLFSLFKHTYRLSTRVSSRYTRASVPLTAPKGYHGKRRSKTHR